MHKVESHIQNILRKYPASKYLVACSGGVDSIVLFHVVHALKLPAELIHVNYQLRGDESNVDEQFVRNLAATKNVKTHVKSLFLQEQLISGGNLQQLAREVRYQFFEELLISNPQSFVLLGHHLEDQSETFFLNLARNAGIMGLAAMPERRENYLRPMLDLSKDEIIDYAKKNSISWREDRSNQSLKYSRNKLRNEVLPTIRKKIPSLDDSVSILTKVFQETQSQLEKNVEKLKSEILKNDQLPISTFEKLSSFEKIELCRQMDQPFGILDTWNQLNHKGTRIELNRSSSCPFDFLIHDGTVFSFIRKSSSSLPEISIETCENLPSSFSKTEVYFDAIKIKGNLTVREPKIGDRIEPIGMAGSKLISDVISDAKLNSAEKSRVFLVEDASNILWVYGLCVSRNAIAAATSEEILKVSLLFEKL